MNNSQDSNQKTIQPIYTLEQLSTSMLVARCIIEIREERRSSINQIAEENSPKLNINNKALQDLFHDFCSAVSYKPAFVYLAKIGFEDMINYEFKEDPSVITTAQTDTAHLQTMVGPNYSILAQTNLLNHSLNVFKQGLDTGKKKGRIMQIAIPILGCLFHDFGKSSLIRKELIGDNTATKGYKAHAEVSAMYVREVLSTKFYNLTKSNPSDTIEMLANAVGSHHPAKFSKDNMVKYIMEADAAARKEEFKKFNQKK